MKLASTLPSSDDANEVASSMQYDLIIKYFKHEIPIFFKHRFSVDHLCMQ
jgi:hypothetical protein